MELAIEVLKSRRDEYEHAEIFKSVSFYFCSTAFFNVLSGEVDICNKGFSYHECAVNILELSIFYSYRLLCNQAL